MKERCRSEANFACQTFSSEKEPAKVSSCHVDHLSQLEDLAPLVRIVLGVEAGPPVVADQVVPDVFVAEVGEGDGVLDEDGVVLGANHEGALAAQGKLVNLDGAPRLHLAGVGLGACLRTESSNFFISFR